VSRSDSGPLFGLQIGVIPAKRLPTGRAHWNYATADLESIRRTLVDAGVIEEPAKKKK